VDGETRIYQDGIREQADSEILHNIEIFSQGDLQRIAEDRNDSLRISLIDRPNASRIKSLSEKRRLNAEELSRIGSTLRTLRAKISNLHQELLPRPALVEQLKQAEESSPTLSPELEGNRILFERRSRIIEALSEINTMQGEVVSHFSSAEYYINRLVTSLTVVQQQEQSEAEDALKSLRQMEADLREISAATNRLQSNDFQSKTVELKRIFDEKNEVFFRLRQEQQSVNESLRKQQHLRRQLEHMEKLQQDLDAAQVVMANLLRQRESLRAQITELDNQIYSLRIKEVDEINKEHGERVCLTLLSDASATGYAALLSSMLSGSRIRSQEEVAAAIAETFTPAALIDIVESGNGQRFAEVLNRDLGQMNRVVSHLIDHPDLYKLEIDPPAARLDITMFDDGHPKPVETLSKGQKATALLPLILRPLPYPLLFDQPEDDLDNSLISKSLVKVIQELKARRQLIFVTHNANIPVLGEADKVVVMSMRSPISANHPIFGSIDERKQEILDLLEGGAQAFRERESRYRDLLSRNGHA
jgi:DNA repair exonuclease SbcCD ATPase subunit